MFYLKEIVVQLILLSVDPNNIELGEGGILPLETLGNDISSKIVVTIVAIEEFSRLTNKRIATTNRKGTRHLFYL